MFIKRFSSVQSQQVTHMEKATLWWTDPSMWTEKPLQHSFHLTLQVSTLTEFKRKWLQLNSTTTWLQQGEYSAKPHFDWHFYSSTSLEKVIFSQKGCVIFTYNQNFP